MPKSTTAPITPTAINLAKRSSSARFVLPVVSSRSSANLFRECFRSSTVPDPLNYTPIGSHGKITRSTRQLGTNAKNELPGVRLAEFGRGCGRIRPTPGIVEAKETTGAVSRQSPCGGVTRMTCARSRPSTCWLSPTHTVNGPLRGACASTFTDAPSTRPISLKYRSTSGD